MKYKLIELLTSFKCYLWLTKWLFFCWEKLEKSEFTVFSSVFILLRVFKIWKCTVFRMTTKRLKPRDSYEWRM
jgi:hypothetical protein